MKFKFTKMKYSLIFQFLGCSGHRSGAQQRHVASSFLLDSVDGERSIIADSSFGRGGRGKNARELGTASW